MAIAVRFRLPLCVLANALQPLYLDVQLRLVSPTRLGHLQQLRLEVTHPLCACVFLVLHVASTLFLRTARFMLYVTATAATLPWLRFFLSA